MRPWTQKSALIQLRTSLLKFVDLAEKSEKSSVSNFSTKGETARFAAKPLSCREPSAAFPTPWTPSSMASSYSSKFGWKTEDAAVCRLGATDVFGPGLKGSIGDGPNQTNYSDQNWV